MLFSEGMPILNIMDMGRWAILQSCRLYIQHAEAELVKLTKRMSPTTSARLRALAGLGPRVFAILDHVRAAEQNSSGPSPDKLVALRA